MKHILLLISQVLTMGSVFAQNISEKVMITRTDYGVPHIVADDLKSVAFGLAYAELEDRGEKVVLPLVRSKGVWAKYTDIEHADSDLYAKLIKEHT